METNTLYIDDFMSDEEDNGTTELQKRIDRKQYEENMMKFDIKKLISNFILKKEYFISHKTTSIRDDFDFEEKPVGQGAFGVVYKAKEKNTGSVRAVKQVMNK